LITEEKILIKGYGHTNSLGKDEKFMTFEVDKNILKGGVHMRT
jgi:hypothetical protein